MSEAPKHDDVAVSVDEHAAMRAELTARVDHAEGRAKSIRRRTRLEVAAKLQRHIASLQASPAPSEWHDGGVRALERLHAEIERDVGDDDPGA